MSTSLRHDRRGIALVLALFAVVVATLLITAVFYIARLEQRMGNSRIAATQAREAAEAGLSIVLGGWTTNYNALNPGGSTPIAQTSLGGGASYRGTVRKLSPTTFLVQMEGLYSVGGNVVTRRQLAKIVRLNMPYINMNAALTTLTGATISGSSSLHGNDSVPGTWGGYCPPPGAMQPGIRDSSGAVTTSGACSGASCITGSPQVQTDPTVTSNDFNTFGDMNWTELTSLADKIISGTINGVGPTFNAGPPVSCRKTDLTNWGDPVNPASVCGSYFPILYAPGSITINSNGKGQGILLVGGNLTLTGGFEFYGPVIVRGIFTSTGTGGHVYGGLMAQGSGTFISGNGSINFSDCAITRALNGSSRGTQFRERSWAQAY